MTIEVTSATARTRFVVVHYHIFKNAGSTIEHVLEREFPDGFARWHGPTPDATLDGEDLAAFLGDYPNVRAVTSHHLRYPLPVIRNVVLFDCCFVRHPLERLDSLYNYYRQIDSDDPLCRSAQRLTPVEFMRHLLEDSPGQASNVQVVQIASGGRFTRPANEHDLTRAIRTMRDMAVPGVVEMFAESMVAAEYFLRPAFPSIKLGTAPRNVSRLNITAPMEREQRLVRLWGKDLYEHLKRLNELDLELFRETAEEIRRRLALTPAVPERLAAFAAQIEYRVAVAG